MNIDQIQQPADIGDLQPAGYWRRCCALAIDSLLFLSIFILFTSLIAFYSNGRFTLDHSFRAKIECLYLPDRLQEFIDHFAQSEGYFSHSDAPNWTKALSAYECRIKPLAFPEYVGWSLLFVNPDNPETDRQEMLGRIADKPLPMPRLGDVSHLVLMQGEDAYWYKLFTLPPPDAVSAFDLGWIILPLALIIFASLDSSRLQATPGKIAMKLRVVRTSSRDKATFGSALLRYILICGITAIFAVAASLTALYALTLIAAEYSATSFLILQFLWIMAAILFFSWPFWGRNKNRRPMADRIADISIIVM